VELGHETNLLTQGVLTVVMKNCEPFVFGPALAIDSRPGSVCLWVKFSSKVSCLECSEFGGVEGTYQGTEDRKWICRQSRYDW